jgi:hypothetical protein
MAWTKIHLVKLWHWNLTSLCFQHTYNPILLSFEKSDFFLAFSLILLNSHKPTNAYSTLELYVK